MCVLMLLIVMTFSVLEGHSPIASLFKCNISYFWCVAQSLCICRASCLSLSVNVNICSEVLKKLLTSGATLDVHCSYPAPPLYLCGYQSAHHQTDDNEDYTHAGPVRVTPLIQAILLGNFDMTQELIRQGASVNFPDSNGRTPLMAAVSVVKYPNAHLNA